MLGASQLSAATLTINSVTGVWQNSVDAEGNPVSGEGTNAINWGVSAGQGQSGYVFEGAAPPALTATDEVDFTLGEFTHNNFPVFPPSLSSVDLLVTLNVEGFGDITSLYEFTHTETPNRSDPCDFAGANGQGVNANGCADQVEATLNLASSDTFTIDDVEFVFNVTGFQVGSTLFDSFLTVEGQSNNAQLVGSFVAADSLAPAPVPLPASGLLLLGGLGLAGFAGRRKAKAA
jgi:hypothetical protein